MARIDARLLGIAGVATIALAACGSGGSSAHNSGTSGKQATTNHGSVVSFNSISGVGKVLVNSKGMTLYSADQEKNGKILCTGQCTGFWFPLTVSGTTVAKPAGFTGTLGTIKRPDSGKMQVTFDGSPLYTFRLDTSSGEAKGNNFTDSFGGKKFTWHAAGASTSSTMPSASSSSNSNSNSGGGYNY